MAVLRRPGPVWVLAALLVTAAVALWLLARQRAPPELHPLRRGTDSGARARQLAPAAKIAVLYATGTLGVQGRQLLFVELPGFYRTFATREHALLCRAQPRRWAAIVAWPEEEQGLWYAFFLPDQIMTIRAGATPRQPHRGNRARRHL